MGSWGACDSLPCSSQPNSLGVGLLRAEHLLWAGPLSSSMKLTKNPRLGPWLNGSSEAESLNHLYQAHVLGEEC